jgi:hypothetical protein
MAVGIMKLICVRWVIVGLDGIARASLELYANSYVTADEHLTPHHRLLLPVRLTEAHNDRCCGRFNWNVQNLGGVAQNLGGVRQELHFALNVVVPPYEGIRLHASARSPDLEAVF